MQEGIASPAAAFLKTLMCMVVHNFSPVEQCNRGDIVLENNPRAKTLVVIGVRSLSGIGTEISTF